MPTPRQEELARRTLEIIPLVMRVMSAEMRQLQHGIHPGHIHLLRLLEKKPISQSELASRMAVSPPTMSNTINAVEERGWVQRRRAENDRRVVWIEITEAGKDALDRMDRGVEEKMAQLLSGLDEEQTDSLLNGLTVLRDAVAEALERDPHLCTHT